MSGYNQPLNNTTTVVWELPFGRDRRWATDLPPVVEGILGGWRLTAINTMASGLPVNLNYSPASAFTVSTVPTYRPNLSGDVYAPEGEQSITNWFNKANITIPTDVSQPFGNAPRNVARGPALYVLDLGLHKGFAAGRQEPLRVPRRGVQRAEQDQLRRAEQQRVGDELRDHHVAGDAGAPDPAGRQVRFLMRPHRGRVEPVREWTEAARASRPTKRGSLRYGSHRMSTGRYIRWTSRTAYAFSSASNIAVAIAEPGVDERGRERRHIARRRRVGQRRHDLARRRGPPHARQDVAAHGRDLAVAVAESVGVGEGLQREVGLAAGRIRLSELDVANPQLRIEGDGAAGEDGCRATSWA